jgi:hypothetical protein
MFSAWVANNKPKDYMRAGMVSFFFIHCKNMLKVALKMCDGGLTKAAIKW